MKRLTSWLAVFCLWTVAVAAFPAAAGATVASGFEVMAELNLDVPQGAEAAGRPGGDGIALPHAAFRPGGIDAGEVQPGGFRSWWAKQGTTLLKGIGAGVIGAGIVAAAALALGAGAPVLLAGAGLALLGGAIYGATADPAGFSWWRAVTGSVLSGACAGFGTGALLRAAGGAAAGRLASAGLLATRVRGLVGAARGLTTGAYWSGLLSAAWNVSGRAVHAILVSMSLGGAIGGAVGALTYALTAGDGFTWTGLTISTLSGAVLGAVATAPGIKLPGLAAAGALTGSASYAATVVAESLIDDKELPPADEFIRESLMSAGFGAFGAAAGGTMPGKALRRALTRAARHYSAANRARAQADVIINTLRSAVASYLSTEGYQVTDEILDNILEEAVQELNRPVSPEQEP